MREEFPKMFEKGKVRRKSNRDWTPLHERVRDIIIKKQEKLKKIKTKIEVESGNTFKPVLTKYKHLNNLKVNKIETISKEAIDVVNK